MMHLKFSALVIFLLIGTMVTAESLLLNNIAVFGIDQTKASESAATASYNCTTCSAPTKGTQGVGLQIQKNETLEKEIPEINSQIDQKGAKWVAGETAVSRLPLEKRKLLCGVKPGLSSDQGKNPINISTPVPFGTFDWRNVNGTDWMTPIKDQAACGSCWAFGTLGSMEAVINIVNHNATIDKDLSEQFLVSCSGAGSCAGGSPNGAYNYTKNVGVADETCFPYVASDVPCNPCPGWEYGAWRITAWNSVSNYPSSIKWALQNYGPLGVGIYAPDDFLYYVSGVYEPVWSSSEWNQSFPYGSVNHWVTLVGYNDTGAYWIIKNSWGANWGEDGYGKIAYGVLESHNWIIAILGVQGPTPQQHDMAAYVEAPGGWIAGKPLVLNATAYNAGLNNETNVNLSLMINSTVVSQTSIPLLPTGSQQTISYQWTPSQGYYNITSYVTPVPGENNPANNAAVKFTYIVTPGLDFLIVADNDGHYFFNGTSQTQIATSLTNAGFNYGVWDESKLGRPNLDILKAFRAVLWTCGDYYSGAVDSYDAATLTSFLNTGGNLLLEGEDIGYDHHNDGFMLNVPHALYLTDNANASTLQVTQPWHPIASGLPSTFSFAKQPPYPDGVGPVNGASEVVRYWNTSYSAITVYDGISSLMGRVVYIAFPLYSLNATQTNTLVTNSIHWLSTIQLQMEVYNSTGQPAPYVYINIIDQQTGSYARFWYSADQYGHYTTILPNSTYMVMAWSGDWYHQYATDNFFLYKKDVLAINSSTVLVQLFGNSSNSVLVQTYNLNSQPQQGFYLDLYPFYGGFGLYVATTNSSGQAFIHVTPGNYSMAARYYDIPSYFLYKLGLNYTVPAVTTFAPASSSSQLNLTIEKISKQENGFSWIRPIGLNTPYIYGFSGSVVVTPAIWQVYGGYDYIYLQNGEWSYDYCCNPTQAFNLTIPASNATFLNGGALNLTMSIQGTFQSGQTVPIYWNLTDSYGNYYQWIYESTSHLYQPSIMTRINGKESYFDVRGPLNMTANQYTYAYLTIRDPDHSPLMETDLYLWETPKYYVLSSSAMNGTYTASIDVNTGPYQGVLNTRRRFLVGEGQRNYTLADFPEPFVDSYIGIANVTLMPGASDPRGPCAPAHTIDVAGAQYLAFALGAEAAKGGLNVCMDWEATNYNSTTVYKIWRTGNIIAFGSPTVNTVSWYYHYYRKTPSNESVLPVYIGKDGSGPQGQYIYSKSSLTKYRMVNDYGQGKNVTDYAMVVLYHDTLDDRYVIISAGLSGYATREAASWLATNPAMTGSAIILRLFDAQGDGTIDQITIAEIV